MSDPNNNIEQFKSVPEKMIYWEQLKSVPENRLKPITAGRLKGKSDINPQWRYEALTAAFGPCGIGWKFEIVKTWNEPGSEGQVFAFALVNLFFKHNDQWSEPIPGQGGSMLVEMESRGLHSSDEAYKMAITDALGTAAKMIGVAAEIYLGQNDGKYGKQPAPEKKSDPQPDLQWLNIGSKEWITWIDYWAKKKIDKPEIQGTEIIKQIKAKFKISKANEGQLLTEIGQKILNP